MGILVDFPGGILTGTEKAFKSDGGGSGGGGDMLETRVAKLESDVHHIDTNLTEARSDIRQIKNDASETKRDVAVILQKLVDIDTALSEKASKDALKASVSEIENKIDKTKIWFLSILLTSIVVPVVLFFLGIHYK